MELPQTTRPTFSNLPTEIKLNVFAFVRSRNDQARECLVNRNWLACMAPLLWKILEMNSTTATADNLAAILHSGNNVIKNIQYIDICEPLYQSLDRCCPELEAVVQIIVTALPLNSLRGFASALSVGLPLLIHLLQCQQTLEMLCVPIDSTTYNFPVKFDAVAYAKWFTSALANVRELILCLREDCPDSYEAGAAFISNAKQLNALSIWAEYG